MNDRIQRFPTTQWNVVIAAQGVHTPDARQALERLFETYWYPVYAFIRSRTKDPADAEDLTQGFFTNLLDHCSLDSVKPELGRFRAFLLASAKHYLSVERARVKAHKRGGGKPALPLDFVSADRRYRLEGPPDDNPEVRFERQWARATFEAAEEELRSQFVAAGKAIQFEAFRPYLAAGGDPVSYAEMAAGLEMTEAAVKVAVHRARRHFGRILREQIAETVAASGAEPRAWEHDINDEISYLFRMLGR